MRPRRIPRDRGHEPRVPVPQFTPAVGYGTLLALLRRSSEPVTIPHIMRQLGLERDAEDALRGQMEFLERRGAVFSQRRGRWSLHARSRVVVGRFVSPRGSFGFVTAEERGGADLFIPPRARHGASHGDRVLARVAQSGRHEERGRRKGAARRGAAPSGPTGEILAVIERRSPRIAAVYHAGPGGGMLLPRDERLGPPMQVTSGGDGAAPADGVVVWAEPVGPQDRDRTSLGRIVSVVGPPEDPGVQQQVIEAMFELPGPFPPEAERDAAALPGELGGRDRRGREDLTSSMVVTIDPEGARDHDDAVGLETIETGRGPAFRLSVHIADVSHYVTEGSAMDVEAQRRGTSVYFPGRHIPMLPMRLTSGLCSLVAGEDRLAQSVIMDFEPEGKCVNLRFADTVIRSRADLTYERALDLMQGEGTPGDDESLRPLLMRMKELSRALRTRRMGRGSLDLDLPETKIQVDAEGRPVGVRAEAHTIAHQAIEEFMLAANETVAGWLARTRFASLYRIHEDPDPAEVDQLEEELGALGFPLRRARGTASVRLGAILEQARGAVEEPAIAMMVLRTLKLARYSHEAVGHFGLAAPLYTHFTSPLRRYPDLVVHRVLRSARVARAAAGEPTDEAQERLAAVALECSTLERRAEEAERAMEAWQEAVYMKGRIGEIFDGVVTGRTERSLFVTLEGLGVEGFVPLPPSGREPARGSGRHPGRRRESPRQPGGASAWRLGDPVRVRVHDVDTFRGRILLRPLSPDSPPPA
ncbi:MAG: ribonuclease R family protein [Candidatus Polarisedimenticolia bacterium]